MTWKVCSAVLLVVVFACVDSASAKRAAPKPVSPVVYEGVTYSAPNDNGRVGYILASDVAGKVLFQIKIFETEIDPNLEEDVQWVFIRELKLTGSSLVVTDEKSRCSSVSLETKAVKRNC